MTIEQQRAIAMARARMRMQSQQQPQEPSRFDSVPTEFGSPGGPPRAPAQTVPQQIGGSLRDVAMGLPKFAALPVDMGVMAVNAAQSLVNPDAQPFRTVSQAADESLNSMGVPQTQNPIIRTVNEALGGGMVSIGPKGLQIGQEAFVPQAPIQSAAQRRAGRAVREIAGGADDRATLAAQLRNYKSPVAGVSPTTAEAVSGMPEGAPLQELQRVVSQVSGAAYDSPSTQFGRQLASNQAAREAAQETLGATHGARREAILANANSLSQRLRNLRDIVARKSQQGDQWLQEEWKARADKAIVDNRTDRWIDLPEQPLLDKARRMTGNAPAITDDEVRNLSRPYVPATGRAPGRYTPQAARSREYASAADEYAWQADKANLERAGAELEKDLLENTGLKDLVPDAILSRVKGAKANPRVYASEISRKTYKQFVDDIEAITQPDGTIDAAALDQVRKEFGPKLSMLFEKEGWNVKDAAFAKAMRSAQGFIDDAIEAAGGTGYKDEIARYAQGTQAIADDALRAENMYTSLQPANVPLANLIDQQTMRGVQNVPGLLNWKLTAGKHLAGALRKQAEPAVVGEMSKMLRKPDDLAWALDERNAQSATEALQRALMQYARRAPGAAGGSRE